MSANLSLTYGKVYWILDIVALVHVKQLCARQESIEESQDLDLLFLSESLKERVNFLKAFSCSV